jgi:hypothetical protein
MGRSHPDLLYYYQVGTQNCSSLESIRGSHTSRCTRILDATTRFEAQELGLGAISPKMVEPQLEGDKVFTTLWATPST